MSTANHSVPAKGGLVCKCAATKATHVGFLSCVDTLVPLEGIELGELLFTVFTAVRTLAWQSFEREQTHTSQIKTSQRTMTKRTKTKNKYVHDHYCYLCVFLNAGEGNSSEQSLGHTVHTCTAWTRCGCLSGALGIL